jgi:hypothetical protein
MEIMSQVIADGSRGKKIVQIDAAQNSVIILMDGNRLRSFVTHFSFQPALFRAGFFWVYFMEWFIMATVNKVLGQAAPAANTATVLYTVPAITEATGKLFITNRGSKDARIWVAITKSGGTLGNKDYICFDKTLAVRDTMEITGIALATGDFVNVKSSKADTSFSMIGTETA